MDRVDVNTQVMHDYLIFIASKFHQLSFHISPKHQQLISFPEKPFVPLNIIPNLGIGKYIVTIKTANHWNVQLFFKANRFHSMVTEMNMQNLNVVLTTDFFKRFKIA